MWILIHQINLKSLSTYGLHCAALVLTLNLLAAQATTIKLPSQSIEEAIGLARAHVKKSELKITDHVLMSAEYFQRYSADQVPFWRIEWRLKAGGKGGQIIVFVYEDGRVEHEFGE